MDTKLFVGNLSRSTTEEHLSELFAQTGEVASVELIALREPGNSHYFAFVDMNSRKAAEKAIQMFNGASLRGRSIKVNMARPREQRPDGGGWYTDSTPPGSRRKGTSRRKSV
jgi:RNA recognition motif-containing protein